MEHFKVLVTGEDVAGQLAPFDEAVQEQWHVSPDYSDEDVVALLRDAVAAEERVEGTALAFEDYSSEELAGLYGKHFGDVDYVSFNGERWVLMTRYNPQAKFSSWEVGGQFAGSFLIDQAADPADYVVANRGAGGFTCDSARRGVLDFAAIEARARSVAGERWAQFLRATAGLQPPALTWGEVQGKPPRVRAEWLNDPWVIAASALTTGDPVVVFEALRSDPREAFVEGLVLAAMFSCDAVLHEGVWRHRSDPDWGVWGGVSSVWEERLEGFVSGLGDGVWLTVVDCVL